jgi:hypothetical protein
MKNLMSEHLRGMILLNICTALFHPNTITDKEMFIADFTELLNKCVCSKTDKMN